MLIDVLDIIDKYRNREKEREIFKATCEGIKDLTDEVDDLIAQLPEDKKEENIMLLMIYLVSHIELRRAAIVTRDLPTLIKSLFVRAIREAPDEEQSALLGMLKEINKSLNKEVNE